MEQNYKQNEYIERRVFVFSVFLLVTIMSASMVLIYCLLSNQIIKTNSSSDTNIPVINENNSDIIEEDMCVYTIKEYNGKIGVYENESLIYTIDKYIFTLPENDKKLLKKGIIVNSKLELYEVLEEYY